MTNNSWACLLTSYFGVSNKSHFSLFVLSIFAPFSLGLSKTNVVEGMLVDNVLMAECIVMTKDLRVFHYHFLFPFHSELCLLYSSFVLLMNFIAKLFYRI